jgi:hypothetical protein
MLKFGGGGGINENGIWKEKREKIVCMRARKERNTLRDIWENFRLKIQHSTVFNRRKRRVAF